MEKGAVVLVTGGSSGIGAAAARQLAEKGCRVAVNYRVNEAGAAATVSTCESAGAEAFAIRGDVSDDSACRRMAEAVEARWGRIDGLVNSAGTTRFHDPFDLEGLTAEDFASSYAVNVTGTFQMTRAAAPAMKRAGGGAVVNVSSFAAAIGAGSSIAYTASKGRGEYAHPLPRPGAGAGDPGELRRADAHRHKRWNRSGLGDERYEKVLSGFVAAAPLKRKIVAEDVADAIVWLVTGAELITGEIVPISAGTHLG